MKHFSPKNKKGLIWVYSEEKPKLRSIEKHVASIENYYMIDTNEGQSNIMEKKFGEIETQAGRVIKKLSENNLKLNHDEMNILIIFMSYLRARIPAFRDSVNDPVSLERKLHLRILAQHEELFKKEMGEISEELDESERFTYSEFKEYITKNIDKLDLRMSQNDSIKTILFSAEELQSIFSKMKWNFLIAPNDCCYITSDRPVFPFMNNWKMPYPLGFAYKDIEVYFPVTPKICMMGTYRDLTISYNASEDKVNVINARILNNFYKYVYSNMSESQFSAQSNITLNKREDLLK